MARYPPIPEASDTSRPLDEILRDRLHLKSRGRFTIAAIRAALATGDAVSRLFSGRPFFAMRESEDILRQVQGLQGIDLLNRVMSLEGGTEFEAQGLDNVPKTGPVLIAATHPTGLFEFCAHMKILHQVRPDIRVVANQETERFLGPDLIIPVRISKENRATHARSIRQNIIDHLDGGGAVLIFGSGRVADRQAGHLTEPEWRGGPTELSKETGAAIVPAALNACNSDGYYRTRAWARRLSGGNPHFGAMIGSLRYFWELLSKLGHRYTVIYGTAMPAGTDRDTLKAAAEGLVPGLYASSGSSNSSG